MRFTALLLIGLIGMTIAYNPDVQFLRSLKRQTFGKTLLDTIQIQLSTTAEGNQIDTIIEQLELLKKQNVDSQKQDTEDNVKFQLVKRDIIKSLNFKITKFTRFIKKDKAIVKGNLAAIKQFHKFLVEQKIVLAKEGKKLKTNKAEQIKVTATYQKEFNQLSSQLVALAAAKVEILNLKTKRTGGAFIQVTNSIKNIQFQHPKFQSMINVLSQMMTEDIISDQKLVQIIIDIIDRLSGELRKEIKILEEAYNMRMDDLKLAEIRIKQIINLLDSNIAANETKIARLNAQNVNADQRIMDNGQRVTEMKNERRDTIRQAADRQKAYVIETSRRSGEFEIIERVITIFKTRFSDDVRAIVNH